MKTKQKTSIMATLLLVSLTASAQCAQELEDQMNNIIAKVAASKVEVTKSLEQVRDVQKEGTPLKRRCDIISFTLPKKQRPLLDEMIKAFEANGHDNPKCYGINSMSESSSGGRVGNTRRLMIGEDTNHYVDIGKDYTNFLNLNILDVADTTKSHRYAYALEWRETHKGKNEVRYIVTYAKIPRVYPTTKTPFSGDFKINPSTLEKIKEGLKSIPPTFERLKGSLDSIHITYDELKPLLNFDKWVPRDSVVLYNQLTNDGHFLLGFYNLRKWYQEHQDTELTAISIYELCKLGLKNGAFKTPDSKEELEQVIADVCKLIDEAKTDTDRKYFQMALEQLEKMREKKR